MRTASTWPTRRRRTGSWSLGCCHIRRCGSNKTLRTQPPIHPPPSQPLMASNTPMQPCRLKIRYGVALWVLVSSSCAVLRSSDRPAHALVVLTPEKDVKRETPKSTNYFNTRIGSNKGKSPEHNQAKHTKHPHSLEWHNSIIHTLFAAVQYLVLLRYRMNCCRTSRGRTIHPIIL